MASMNIWLREGPPALDLRLARDTRRESFGLKYRVIVTYASIRGKGIAMQDFLTYDRFVPKEPVNPKLCECHGIPDYECPDVADSQPDWDLLAKDEDGRE